MPEAGFVAGDWGTTHSRFFLCARDGTVLDSRSGPGVAQADASTVLEPLLADWDTHQKLPAILCGMVGSTIGWREVPYLPCPVDPLAIANNALRFRATGREIVITPGLSCTNRLSAPDLMRGEETQTLGAMQIEPGLRKGTQVLCLPGTHTKWVLLRDGKIAEFLTALTGETFDVLRRHSILLGRVEGSSAVTGSAFSLGLEQAAKHRTIDLLHLLFETRSRQLTGELAADEAASYLSGLLIGRDVSGALRLFETERAEAGRITLVGDAALCALYTGAFKSARVSTQSIDGKAASLAGLVALHEAAFNRGRAGHAA